MSVELQQYKSVKKAKITLMLKAGAEAWVYSSMKHLKSINIIFKEWKTSIRLIINNKELLNKYKILIFLF